MAVLTEIASDSGGNNSSLGGEKAGEDPPEAVKASEPLAKAFLKRMENSSIKNPRVFVWKDGSIFLLYDTQAKNEPELETEIHNLAKEFAMVVRKSGEPAKTLSIVTDRVKAIVPRPTVKAYVNDEIETEAYLETITITDAETKTTAG